MATRIGGFRKKTRNKLKKPHSLKGKIKIRNFLQKFEIGERVNLTIEPAVHGGMYLPRFKGRSGIVKRQLGTCYEVEIKDINKLKTLVIHPIHLKKN
jgi:large subunit ribosomal protein L21e